MLYLLNPDPFPLQKPVCRRGTILLGKLVMVLTAVEYFRQYLNIMTSRLLKESAGGIFTLNLKDTSYIDVTREIRQVFISIQKKGAAVEKNWTPGSASTVRNEIANQLALILKAATDASKQPEDKHSTNLPKFKDLPAQRPSKQNGKEVGELIVWQNQSLTNYQLRQRRSTWICPSGKVLATSCNYKLDIKGSMTTERN